MNYLAKAVAAITLGGVIFMGIVPEGPINMTQANYESAKCNYVELPSCDTNMYCYMDYRAITNTKSDQYRYTHACYISEDGILYYEEDGIQYYAAALGTAYADCIGRKYKVTLECGEEFYIFVGDIKADSCTQDGHKGTYIRNYDGETCMNVVEFITYTPEMPRGVKRAGTYSFLKKFGGAYGNGGNISSMEKLGILKIKE